ncbi:MAG: LuxR C-terminal-related transcriptional regulator [Nitrospirota bacterium]
MDETAIGILLAEAESADIDVIRRSLIGGSIHNPLVVARDGQAALDLLRARSHEFGVAILDIHLPKVGGLDVLPEAKRLDPELVVIMLTGRASVHTAVRSLRREGAFDYVRKSKGHLPNLVEAVRLAITKRALNRHHPWTPSSGGGHERMGHRRLLQERLHLSNREWDVIICLCRGDTNKEIGARLLISDLTVKGYLKQIYKKMGVHTRAAAVSTALAHTPPPADSIGVTRPLPA